jgi:hypothetical protein
MSGQEALDPRHSCHECLSKVREGRGADDHRQGNAMSYDGVAFTAATEVRQAMLTLKCLFDGWHKLLTVGAAALIIPGLINTHAWAVGGGDPIEPEDRALAERMVRIEAGGKTCSVTAGTAAEYPPP